MRMCGSPTVSYMYESTNPMHWKMYNRDKHRWAWSTHGSTLCHLSDCFMKPLFTFSCVTVFVGDSDTTLIPRLAQRRIKPHSRLFNIVHRLKLYPAQTVRCMYACTTYLLNAQHSITQKERYFSCSASLSAHIESVFICFIWHWNFQGYIQTMLELQGRIYRGGSKGENFHPALEPPPSSPPASN